MHLAHSGSNSAHESGCSNLTMPGQSAIGHANSVRDICSKEFAMESRRTFHDFARPCEPLG